MQNKQIISEDNQSCEEMDTVVADGQTMAELQHRYTWFCTRSLSLHLMWEIQSPEKRVCRAKNETEMCRDCFTELHELQRDTADPSCVDVLNPPPLQPLLSQRCSIEGGLGRDLFLDLCGDALPGTPVHARTDCSAQCGEGRFIS